MVLSVTALTLAVAVDNNGINKKQGWRLTKAAGSGAAVDHFPKGKDRPFHDSRSDAGAAILEAVDGHSYYPCQQNRNRYQ
jgi:hypothetical protein